MFDKLDDLLLRYEDIMNELNEPSVVSDQERFRRLMKEQSDLQPLIDAYKEYKKCKETVEESLMMLEEENDEEMRELLKEELNEAKVRIEELEHTMKILLLPKGRTMTRTLSWRSVPVPAETRQLSLLQRFTGCMSIMPRAAAGGWS